MAAEGDDNLQLMRASAGLLSNLQVALTKLLWKRGDKRVHHLVRVRDLDHVIQLVCFASLYGPTTVLISYRLNLSKANRNYLTLISKPYYLQSSKHI